MGSGLEASSPPRWHRAEGVSWLRRNAPSSIDGTSFSARSIWVPDAEGTWSSQEPGREACHVTNGPVTMHLQAVIGAGRGCNRAECHLGH